MKVIFSACGSRKATVRITIDAGSIVEYGGTWTPGIAHLTEHMVFQGCGDFDQDILNKQMASLGADHNAGTWHNRVGFYVEAPAENINKAVELMALTLLNRTFDQESLDKEKLVVLVEERNGRDDIDATIRDRLISFLCKGPIAVPIIGTAESIVSISLEELQAFYDHYYKPSRMLMTITGPSDLNCDELASHFGGDTGRFLRTKDKHANKHLKSRRLVWPADVKQARMFIAHKAFSMGDVRSKDLYFMSRFFSNGVDSRLFYELRQKRGLCYGIGSSIVIEDDIGWFIIHTKTSDENIPACTRLVYKEIKKFLENGPTEEEIIRAKNKYISDIYGFIETSYGLNTMLEMRAFNNLPPIENSINAIKRMTANKIMPACREVFQKDNRKVFICVPQGDVK